MNKVLFTATVDSHINHFHIPYLKFFKDKGYEVHVATNTDEPIQYCDVKHKISFERSPYKINNLKAIKQLKKILSEEKFDIIHTHTPMGSVITRIAAKNTRKENNTKVIYTAHGFHFYKGAPILNWLLFYPIEKILSKYTDILITINNEDYELAKKKFNKTKVEYIPGVGVDENKFNFEMTIEEKNKLRESFNLQENDFVMIYTAEVNKNKNQVMAIEAMRHLIKENYNIHLLLVGKGNLKKYYENKVKEYNIQNNIHFLDYRTDVPELLKISDLAISTSKREGLPINIIESMMSGLPTIVTNCRGNRDLVIEEINGYIVELNNIIQFSETVLKLYCSEDKKNKFSHKSKEAAENYELKKIIEKVKEIYENIG
ncbi:MAG: glycosyl transferase [Clostridia bacterium]|jgi:glycosyltransferase EpsD|nr:glycosyl transferase [Clostridia bacterium]